MPEWQDNVVSDHHVHPAEENREDDVDRLMEKCCTPDQEAMRRWRIKCCCRAHVNKLS